MTKYPIETPEPLWKGYRETVSKGETLNEPLARYVARRVIEHEDEVPSEAIEAAEDLLDGRRGGV